MNAGEIKKKASEFFTEYLNHTIDNCCGNETTAEGIDDFFPLDVLKNTNRFSDTLKDHSQEMVELFLHSKNKTGIGYSLEMESVNTRSNGRKSIIKRVYFAEENDYLDYINVRGRVENLKAALTVLSQDGILPAPQLRNWAKKHVKDLTVAHNEGAVFWHNIALCALWSSKKSKDKSFQIQPDFLEANRNLIQSLFSTGETEIQITQAPIEHVQENIQTQAVIPVQQAAQLPQATEPVVIDSIAGESIPTAKSKPFSIRFRSLSANSPLKLGRLVPKEIALPLDDFIHLNQTNFLKEITTILIVGSETVFQSFLPSEHVLCIFGPDYAVNALKLCEWFSRYQLIYFGDISEHCFDVLSAFRNSWAKTETMCMDGNTWEKFFNHAESGPHLKNNAIPKNLTDSEKTTFLALRLAVGKSKLLQEKIPLEYMNQFLDAIKICGSDDDESAENPE